MSVFYLYFGIIPTTIKTSPSAISKGIFNLKPVWGSLFLWCALVGGGCNSLFYYPTGQSYIKPDKLQVEWQSLNIVTEDNLKLKGMLLLPQGASKGVVIHFHGNAQNMTSHVMFVRWLVDYNYHVVIFDYRGYGGSEGTPSRQGLVKDGIALLRFIAKDQALSGLDAVILAQSLGGAVALPAFALAGVDNIKAIVLDSTFSSYRQVTRDKLAGFWLTWPFQWPLSFLVSDDYSPIDYSNAIKIPTLFIHGTADRVVPMESALELYQALEGKKDFWVVENGPHTAAFSHPQSPYRLKLVEYMEELKKAPPRR